MNNVLEKIIKRKIQKLEETKKNISLELLKDKKELANLSQIKQMELDQSEKGLY